MLANSVLLQVRQVRFRELTKSHIASKLWREDWNLRFSYSKAVCFQLLLCLLAKIKCKAVFSNISVHQNPLKSPQKYGLLSPCLEFPVQYVWEGTWEFAFLTSSQLLLVQGPHFETHCSKAIFLHPRWT